MHFYRRSYWLSFLGLAVPVVAFALSVVAQTPAPPVALNWAPPDIDLAPKPSESSVPCVVDDVTRNASKRVQELVDNMQRFGAKERVEFQEFDRKGIAQDTRNATFDYAAYIHETAPQQLAVEEYRNNSVAAEEFPSRLATTGTAAFALLFHPNYLKDFAITCEGLTEWKGHSAWRLHLRQTKANNFRGYRLANRYFPVMLKARA
jgi:hypothetical protein